MGRDFCYKVFRANAETSNAGFHGEDDEDAEVGDQDGGWCDLQGKSIFLSRHNDEIEERETHTFESLLGLVEGTAGALRAHLPPSDGESVGVGYKRIDHLKEKLMALAFVCSELDPGDKVEIRYS